MVVVIGGGGRCLRSARTIRSLAIDKAASSGAAAGLLVAFHLLLLIFFFFFKITAEFRGLTRE